MCMKSMKRIDAGNLLFGIEIAEQLLAAWKANNISNEKEEES